MDNEEQINNILAEFARLTEGDRILVALTLAASYTKQIQAALNWLEGKTDDNGAENRE